MSLKVGWRESCSRSSCNHRKRSLTWDQLCAFLFVVEFYAMFRQLIQLVEGWNVLVLVQGVGQVGIAGRKGEFSLLALLCCVGVTGICPCLRCWTGTRGVRVSPTFLPKPRVSIITILPLVRKFPEADAPFSVSVSVDHVKNHWRPLNRTQRRKKTHIQDMKH